MLTTALLLALAAGPVPELEWHHGDLEAALGRALESGKVRGAALDVFETEPVPADHPLLGRDDVIVTPHLGASTSDAQVRVAVQAAEQIVALVSEDKKVNALNEV